MPNKLHPKGLAKKPRKHSVAMQPQIKADLLLVGVAILAAAGWIFSKEALAGLPPLLFIGTRFLFAGTLLAIVGKTQWQHLSVKGAKSSLLVGVIFAIAIMCWIIGLDSTQHIGEGAFITSLAVVQVPLMAFFLFREPQSKSMWLALPIATAGLFLLAIRDPSVGFQLESGQVYFLTASIIFALQFTLNSRVVQYVPAILLTSIQLLTVGIVSIGASFWLEQWPNHITPAITGWLLASVIIATSLRFFIQTYAQGLTPVSHGAMILTIEPILTASLAAFWFGESMTLIQIAGCGLIFSSLLINRWQIIQKIFK